MDKKKKTTTQDFIKQLSVMTKEEMYDYIKKNGKPPKPIRMYYFLSSTKVSN